MSDTPYKLIGFADPGGVSLGFLVPLFADRQTNTPLVQTVDNDGVIAGFEPYGSPEAEMLRSPDIETHVGDLALYAYAFGKGDVEVTTRDRPAPFADRLDDPVLVGRPLVAMELADFLHLGDRRCEFAALAHAEMRRASDETADHWRDLSVLTIELRRELVRRPHRSGTRLADVVVARVKDGVLAVAGTGGRPSAEQFAILKEAALAALSTLSPLYPPPERGWQVTLRWSRSEERKPRYEAALLLASPSALNRGTRGEWPQPPLVKIFTSDGPEYASEVEETSTPLFVAYDSGEPEQMRRATGDWTVRDMHGIGVGGPRRLPVEADSQHWRTTHVHGASISGGASQADRGVFAGMRLAVAAELDRRAQDITWPPKNSLLLRARGLGTDPNADAWAALYDRAWGLGIDPTNALLLDGVEGSRSSSQHEAGWAPGALFQDGRNIASEVIRRVMEETRTSAALLVDATPISKMDGDRYRRPVMRLLERHGWHINDGDMPEPTIYGGSTRIALAFEPPGGSFVKSTKSDASNIDLGSIERVVVTSAASPGVVVERLAQTGQLVVNVRDLVFLNSREATVFSLLEAQLRRLVTGLPSRSRTRFLGMLVNQALRSGNTRVRDAGPLHAAFDPYRPAGDIELAVSSARFDAGWTYVEIRISDTDSSLFRSRPSGTFRYRLSVAHEGVAIADS